MDELDAFYQRLLARQPEIANIRAVIEGFAEFGRDFGSPTINEHLDALTKARAAQEPIGPDRIEYCTCGRALPCRHCPKETP